MKPIKNIAGIGFNFGPFSTTIYRTSSDKWYVEGKLYANKEELFSALKDMSESRSNERFILRGAIEQASKSVEENTYDLQYILDETNEMGENRTAHIIQSYNPKLIRAAQPEYF